MAPAGLVEVNQQLTLANQLGGLYLPRPNGPTNLLGVSTEAPTAVGAVTGTAMTNRGPASYAGSGSGWTQLAPDNIRATNMNAASFFALVWTPPTSTFNGSGNPRAFGLLYNDANGSPWDTLCLLTKVDASIVLSYAVGAGYNELPSGIGLGSLPGGDVSSFIGVLTPGVSVALYLNGTLRNSDVPPSGTVSTSSTTQVATGIAADRGPGSAGLGLLIGGVWPRALTSSEIAQLSAEPFGLLRPVRRRRFYHPTAAAPSSRPPMIFFVS